MTTLAEKIRELLAFYSLWGVALSHSQIQQFFSEKISADFLSKNFIQIQDKSHFFYTVPENRMSVQEQKERKKEAETVSAQLQKKARRFAQMLRHFPCIRAVALANTAAMGTATEESDIDFLIIAKKNRIWTARFFATFFFAFFGLRTKPHNQEGKVCLSFFLTEEAFDFSAIKLDQDIYLAVWISTLIPLCNARLVERLQLANTKWIESERGFTIPSKTVFHEERQSRSWVQSLGEVLLPQFLEPFFKRLLLWKARKFLDPQSSSYNSDIILNESMQKLHNPDRRREIQQEWREIL